MFVTEFDLLESQRDDFSDGDVQILERLQDSDRYPNTETRFCLYGIMNPYGYDEYNGSRF